MTVLHTKIDEAAEEYLLTHSQTSMGEMDVIFNSAYKFAEPYMQISKIQATALQFFIRVGALRNIVEIGTFVGFSAFSMARAVADPEGKVVSIEISGEFHKQAKWNLHEFCANNSLRMNEFGAVERLKFLHGDAKVVLETIHEIIQDIDLLFLDGDKDNYSFYLDWAIANLKSGAYFIVDNALFKGGVVAGNGPLATKIRAMTKSLQASKAFDYFFLTAGDCMIVAKKK